MFIITQSTHSWYRHTIRVYVLHVWAYCGHHQVHRAFTIITRVEAGSNTSTVTLRVIGGDEKGSLKSETVKYGRESLGTRTRERLRRQGPAAYTKDRSALSSERAPQNNQIVTVKQ
jgi:hypothetical protein